MLLDKPYMRKSGLKINLQLFAGKKKDKLEGLDADDLKSLKDELESDDDSDSDEDDDDPEDDASDDDGDDADDDEKEDVDEDPENQDDADDEDSEDDEESDDDSEEDDDTAAGEGGKGKKGDKPAKDKKTGAIIALRSENKELKARLDALERGQREKEYESEIDKLAARYEEELIDDGMDEEKARKRAKLMAEDKIESKKALDRDMDIQVERLEEKGYTDIRSKLSILKPIVQKAGLTLEEAYRAKYGQPAAKANRTQKEQLALLEKKKAPVKKTATATGTTKTEEKVPLSKRDERIFNEMRKKDPKLTKKSFASLMKDFNDD